MSPSFSLQDLIAQGIAGVEVHYKRGELLTAIGEQEEYLYEIIDGALSAYILSDGDEQVIRLGYTGSIINALPSFLSQTPSHIGLRALRATRAYRINRADFRAAVHASAESTRSYADLLEQLFLSLHERELDLLIASPSQRLARVLKRSPMLFQEVPAKYIASYLRMTPETLSRLSA